MGICSRCGCNEDTVKIIIPKRITKLDSGGIYVIEDMNLCSKCISELGNIVYDYIKNNE